MAAASERGGRSDGSWGVAMKASSQASASPAKPIEVLCSLISPGGEVLYWTTPTPPQDIVTADKTLRYVKGHHCRPDRLYYYRFAESRS